MAAVSKKKVTKKKASKKKSVSTEATKKKVAKKKASGAKKATTKKVATKATVSSQLEASPIGITPEERWKMVAVAAYHKAEKRDFAPGYELQDWTEAEQEIDAFLSGR